MPRVQYIGAHDQELEFLKGKIKLSCANRYTDSLDIIHHILIIHDPDTFKFFYRLALFEFTCVHVQSITDTAIYIANFWQNIMLTNKVPSMKKTM